MTKPMTEKPTESASEAEVLAGKIDAALSNHCGHSHGDIVRVRIADALAKKDAEWDTEMQRQLNILVLESNHNADLVAALQADLAAVRDKQRVVDDAYAKERDTLRADLAAKEAEIVRLIARVKDWESARQAEKEHAAYQTDRADAAEAHVKELQVTIREGIYNKCDTCCRRERGEKTGLAAAEAKLKALQDATRAALHEVQIKADPLSKLCRKDRDHDHAMLRWLRSLMTQLQTAHDVSLAPPATEKPQTYAKCWFEPSGWCVTHEAQKEGDACHKMQQHAPPSGTPWVSCPEGCAEWHPPNDTPEKACWCGAATECKGGTGAHTFGKPPDPPAAPPVEPPFTRGMDCVCRRGRPCAYHAELDRLRGEAVDEPWPEGVSSGTCLPCSDCGTMPRFDYNVDDDFWRRWVPGLPERLSVVCLPCLDRRCGGVGLDAALKAVHWTGTGHTVVLTPHQTHRYTPKPPSLCSRPVPYTSGARCVLEVDHREPCDPNPKEKHAYVPHAYGDRYCDRGFCIAFGVCHALIDERICLKPEVDHRVKCGKPASDPVHLPEEPKR